MKQLFTRMNKYTSTVEVAAFAKAARAICEGNGWMNRNTYPYSFPVKAGEIIAQLESYDDCTSGSKQYLKALANGFMDVLEMWATKPRRYWKNRETGELLTLAEMLKQGAELYDLGDDTNAVAYGEHYELVSVWC